MEVNVPSGWRATVVEDVCDILDAKRVPLSHNNRSQRQGKIPYWGANGIIDHIDDFIFYEPLILMAEDGGYFDKAKTRPICYLLNGKAWVNNHSHVLRVKPGNLREWVYYWFVHRNITGYINIGTRAKLNLKDLRQLPLLLPPLAEQKKIVAILTSVEDVIGSIQATIDQTQKLKKCLLQQLFTKGVGHVLLKQTEAGEIPASWDATHLDKIIHKIEGGGTPAKKKTEYWGGGIPWASVKDIIDYVLDDTQDHITLEGLNNSSAKLIAKNNVIIAVRMAIGKSAISKRDVAINQDLRAVYFNSDIYKPFMHQWFMFNEKYIASLGVGTTVKGIRQEVLKALAINVPPLAEQKKITKILESMDEAILPAKKVLQQMKNLKHGLMSDLLAGRVRVTGIFGPPT